MWLEVKAFDLFSFLTDSQDWSKRTFGPPRKDSWKGVVAHIEEELDEIRKEPYDIEEWMDVVILGLDGAYRSGATPEMICNKLMFKLEKNMARQWPDWRTAEPGKPINHIKN